MKHGKYEAKAPTPLEGETRSRRWLTTAASVLALGAAILLLILGLSRVNGQDQSTEPRGRTASEILEAYQRVSQILENGDMVLTLLPDDPSFPAEPIVLTLSPAQSRVQVDLKGLERDLEEEVGKVSRGRYELNPADYISVDRSALRTLAQQTEAEWAQPFQASSVLLSDRREAGQVCHDLVLNTGRRGWDIRADDVYEALLNAYLAGDLQPTLRYEARTPQALDPEAIWTEYCQAPVDAVLDEQTFHITPEISGYGVPRAELERVLTEAEEGTNLILPMGPLEAEVTVASIEASLYDEILAEVHSPHSQVRDRTNNLILACEAINGTVLLPGETFSFNETVGERTRAKGYREAAAYVGTNTVDELGGGVCQVASSIYYAVLQADLTTVERHCHTFLVTYVPKGMDAAIYWGQLDYRFQNSSPYPLKIEAWVADGQVHIILWGTEWKDYTLELSSKTLKEIPWETVQQVVTDGSYKDGEVIVSAYTGYKVETYKTIYDREGNLVETVKIAYSSYSKRDRVVAVVQPVGTGDD